MTIARREQRFSRPATGEFRYSFPQACMKTTLASSVVYALPLKVCCVTMSVSIAHMRSFCSGVRWAP